MVKKTMEFREKIRNVKSNSKNDSSNASKLPSYLQPSLLSKRHIQSHFTPSATTPHVLGANNKYDNVPSSTTSILKAYQQQQPINNSNATSSKIEISRIYSASNKLNKPFSMSTNDLTQSSNSKGLKLPPVNNIKMNNNDTIMVQQLD